MMVVRGGAEGEVVEGRWWRGGGEEREAAHLP